MSITLTYCCTQRGCLACRQMSLQLRLFIRFLIMRSLSAAFVHVIRLGWQALMCFRSLHACPCQASLQMKYLLAWPLARIIGLCVSYARLLEMASMIASSGDVACKRKAIAGIFVGGLQHSVSTSKRYAANVMAIALLCWWASATCQDPLDS